MDHDRRDTFTLESLRAEGFRGFARFAALAAAGVPDSGGIYVVVRESTTAPVFLESSPGGRFKGRDPSVAVAVLQQRWVASCPVVYIGKATSLNKRLRQFHNFGQGRPVGHWGGRYIWQLADSGELRVGWKVTPSEDPRQAEIDLLARFSRERGCLPFANLVS